MIERINQLFCRHKVNQVVCWHYTHGSAGNEISYIEVQIKCKKCGKYGIIEIKDTECQLGFISTYDDKYWSDTCKPMR